MTYNMRSAFLVSASMGVTIAGAILSAAIISGAPAAAAESQEGAPSTMAQLIYSPWAKFCGRGSFGGREVCFTGKDARTKDGQTFMAATLVEPEGQPTKLLLSVPSSLNPRGPRIIIDTDPEISSTFFSCSANTCTADYEATPELVDKLKKGQMLQIQVGGLAPMIQSFCRSLTVAGTALPEPTRGRRLIQRRSGSNKKGAREAVAILRPRPEGRLTTPRHVAD